MRALGLGIATALLLAAAVAAQPPPSVEGIWDLTWQTRRGPRQSGSIVLIRRGAVLEGELRGKGSVHARGSVSGSGFVLRGRRMLVPYTIEGNVRGDRMEGSISMLSVNRRFTGIRRP
ncbi:MAG TPA: hypothetical protein VGW40_01355 [Allosphingosinicella sp.]|nr:hypothetical protein [Allosphingosinicella sp.]